MGVYNYIIYTHKVQEKNSIKQGFQAKYQLRFRALSALLTTCRLKKLKTNLLYQKTRIDEDNKAEDFIKLDDKFHELICEFSDCEMTWKVIQSFKGQLDRIRYLSMGHESPLDSLIEEHEVIITAIENGDFEKARDLLKTHLNEIMMTHVSIKEKYASWFEDNDI